MSWAKDFFDGLRALAEAVQVARQPHEIVIRYPSGSAGHGAEAGRFLLRHSEESTDYEWKATPREIGRYEAMSELVVNHRFLSLDSFGRFLNQYAAPAIFLGPDKGTLSMEIIGLLEPEHPERGHICLDIPRHPVFKRWSRVTGFGEMKDLDHLALADLLIDNQEDLVEPLLARVVSSFRGARQIDYSADLDTSHSMGVRVTWRGSPQGDPKSTDAQLPRTFSARIPAFTGGWPPGEEPKHEAIFRLRVVAPKEGAAPIFRVMWLNAAEYELEATRALEDLVQGHFKAPVYAGTASITRYAPYSEEDTP
jgi:hypothetical protein